MPKLLYQIYKSWEESERWNGLVSSATQDQGRHNVIYRVFLYGITTHLNPEKLITLVYLVMELFRWTIMYIIELLQAQVII